MMLTTAQGPLAVTALDLASRTIPFEDRLAYKIAASADMPEDMLSAAHTAVNSNAARDCSALSHRDFSMSEQLVMPVEVSQIVPAHHLAAVLLVGQSHSTPYLLHPIFVFLPPYHLFHV